ncbi:hypothetical protein ACHWQZ_G001999 [Mnemiopsis leidyi]
MDNTQEIPGDLITKLTVYAEKERLPMIAGIDSNAHHVAWGHPSTNDRGRKLLQAISANGLIICNTGNKPTFVGKLGHSVIDLTICNPLGLNLIRDWRVNSGKSLSDHEVISFNLEIGQTSSFAFRSLSRCDWALYHQLIETEISRTPFWFKPVHTAEDLNARQHFISDLMRRCFNTACPLSTGIRRSSIPWWSAELTKAKQTAKALRRKANRTKNNSDWEHYRTANRAYSKLLKQSKRKGWKQFCDELKGTSTLARISKILNKDSQSQGTLNSLKKPNGELTNSPQETLQVISDTLIPEGGHPSPSTAGHKGDDAMILKILAPHRITRAVQSLQTNKSPGPDEIRNEMIIKAWDFIKDPVRMIFHNSLRLGITPDSWKNNTGIILPKPLKTDYTNPRAFRIISLTSNFQKLLERLILWHLELDLKVPSRLTKNQHGFRKGKSTESAIHILTRRIEDAIATGNYSLGVFLDIEQAFDAISFAAIREALHEANIPSTITEWIHHMVSNRYITLSYCGTSVRKRATKGSPQGGVLSPFLWNITLNTFLSGLGLHNNFVQAFADDLVILIRGICISTIRGIAQLLLNRINSWCYSKGLRLSGIKSTAILFTNKRDITLDKPLKVEDTEVPLVNSTTYLGVTLDRKLNWGPHILAKCDKAIDSQAAIRAISSTNITSVMVLDTTNQLNKLATRNTVEIRWIPGHKGVQGNETADEMARKGSAAQPIGPEPFLPIPQSLIQKQIHDYLFRLHIKQYRNIPISDKGKIPLLTTLQRYKYRTPKLSTAHRRWLTWLLTGHSPLAYFQHRAQNFTSPHCSFCPGEEETSEHFLGTCVGYMTIRLQTLGKCILSLDEIANLKWQNIIKYISESKRFDIEDLFG